jgi:LysR family transcriptional activator of nhaA
MLEKTLGAPLFERQGRNLVLTDMGQVVYRYADEIFCLGRELQRSLEGQPVNRPLQLSVGVAESLPKLLVYRFLEPALHLPQPVQLICEQGRQEALLSQLALHALDVVFTDAPAGPGSGMRAVNHLLGESGVSFLAVPKLAAAYRRSFPQSLNGAPFLLPAASTPLRRALHQWFDRHQIRPDIRGEIGDPALLKTLGEHGLGIFTVRTVLEEETERMYKVRLIGRVDSIRERFYAISAERKLKHPAVVAIAKAAQERFLI